MTEPDLELLLPPGEAAYDGRWRRAARRSGVVWSIRTLMLAALLTVLVWMLPIPDAAAWGVTAGLAAGTLFAVGFYFPQRARTTRWRVADGVLELESGVIVRNRRRVRLAHIQCVATVRTPLMRLFGVTAVVWYLPGGAVVADGVRVSEAPGRGRESP